MNTELSIKCWCTVYTRQ